jgi:exosortase K
VTSGALAHSVRNAGKLALRTPLPDLLALLGVLGLDYALKSYASHAGPRELEPLLAPTALLVARFTGHAFSYESGSGYVSRELFVVIAPVCSGVNFAIVAFTTLALGFVTRLATPLYKMLWLGASAVLAYAATVLANAVRITLALGPGRALAAHGVLSGEAAHRAVGVGVYLGGLLALHTLAGLGLARHGTGTVSRFALVPLGSYLAVTVMTPLLRGASSTTFWTHTAVVVGAAGSVIAVLWLCPRVAAWTKRALGHLVERAVGTSGVRFGMDVAQRRRERSLSG